jgi:hypothetical protein
MACVYLRMLPIDIIIKVKLLPKSAADQSFTQGIVGPTKGLLPMITPVSSFIFAKS